MNFFKKCGHIFDLILDLFAYASIVVIVFLLISVCLSVVMRYFFAEPFDWIVQTSQYCLVFITFMGSAWLLQKDKHVKMDILSSRLTHEKTAILGCITSIIGTIVCAIISYYSIFVTVDRFVRKLYDTQVLEVPLWPLFAIIALGSLTLFFQFCRRTYGFWEEYKKLSHYKEGPFCGLPAVRDEMESG